MNSSGQPHGGKQERAQPEQLGSGGQTVCGKNLGHSHKNTGCSLNASNFGKLHFLLNISTWGGVHVHISQVERKI